MKYLKKKKWQFQLLEIKNKFVVKTVFIDKTI